MDQHLPVSMVVLVVEEELHLARDHMQEVQETDKREQQILHQRKVILVEQVNMLLAPGKLAVVVVDLVVLEEMEHLVLVQLDMVEQVFELPLLVPQQPHLLV